MKLVLKPAWDTHDFKVKMLDWSEAHGSRLAYLCRFCGRRFCKFAKNGQEAWAVDGAGRALNNAVSERWVSEQCPRLFRATDEEDRKRPREGVGQ